MHSNEKARREKWDLEGIMSKHICLPHADSFFLQLQKMTFFGKEDPVALYDLINDSENHSTSLLSV